MRPLAVILPLLALLVAIPLSAQEPKLKGKRYAILIGVNRYVKRGPYADKPLRFAERDMTELNAVLAKDGFDVTLLLGSATGENEATRENIHRVLIDKKTTVLKNVTNADTVLVAFAGHGEQIRMPELDATGKPKRDAQGQVIIKEEIPFFLPKDAVSQDPDTQISINEVLESLAQRGGGNNIVLVDACRTVVNRAEPGRRGATMDRGKVQALGQGFSVMFSCSDRQEALESEKADGGHGLFFCSVIDALKKTQPNRKGQVTWGQLFPRITERLEELTEEIDVTTPKERQQRPQAINNVIGDPVLLAKGSGEQEQTPANGEVVEDFEWKGETRKRTITKINLGGEVVEFVTVPAGSFLMGSPESDKHADADEKPQHKVTFTKANRVGKFTITKGQFAAFVKATGYQTEAETDDKGGHGYDGKEFKQSKDYNWKNTGWTYTDRHPVVNVSYNDAVAYCEWASKQVKRTIRLLTEAEYEYANRAKTTTRYFTGDDANSLDGYANIADRTAKAKFSSLTIVDFDDGYMFSSPVGIFFRSCFSKRPQKGDLGDSMRIASHLTVLRPFVPSYPACSICSSEYPHFGQPG